MRFLQHCKVNGHAFATLRCLLCTRPVIRLLLQSSLLKDLSTPSSSLIWRILSVCVVVKSLNLLMVAMFYKATLENPVLKDLPSAADQNKAALRSAVKICGHSSNQESFHLGELYVQVRDPCLRVTLAPRPLGPSSGKSSVWRTTSPCPREPASSSSSASVRKSFACLRLARRHPSSISNIFDRHRLRLLIETR